MPTFDYSLIFQLGFYIATLFFTIHFIVLAYHWLSFGASKRHSLIALGLYMFGGVILLLTIASSASFI